MLRVIRVLMVNLAILVRRARRANRVIRASVSVQTVHREKMGPQGRRGLKATQVFLVVMAFRALLGSRERKGSKV